MPSRSLMSTVCHYCMYRLIMCAIAARDVVAKLHEDKVDSPLDFQWISQLRYYFEEGAVMVKMITTEVPYGYEYLGEYNFNIN